MEHLLKNLHIIVKPTEEAFEAFRESITVRKVEKNKFYLHANKKCSHVGLVAKGGFRMFYDAGGKDISKGFAFENDFIGSLASFLSQTPSKINIVALEDSIVAEFKQEKLFELINKYKEWRRFATIIIEDQFLKMEHREASLLMDTPEVRFRKLMEEHPKIFKKVSLHHIASYLSITPETLSRYRTKLRLEKP